MDNYISEIRLFAFNFAPEGWLKCDGSLLNVAQNQALFALIGATYGGDGKTTFAIPNLIEAQPNPNTIFCIAIQGIWPQRA